MEVNNWVSMLKENADRTMSTVNYTLLSSSGPSHNPVFTYRAELRGEGSASRQGLAKARAAKDLMARVSSTMATEPPQKPVDAASDLVFPTPGRGNYVGELQELCQKRHWPLPLYVEQGVSTTGQFLCRFTAVMDSAQQNADICIRALATGWSKKMAKLKAADYVLSIVKKLDK
ncbi:Hypothetical protein SMAX5B_001403 [Scophthalmus maximus]|uniref:DRBM domain-containing protein n=1 Tax=Scophthalmus maximus TaxID=52904 RepID=A0A2U9CP16_SCOMX|nr:Hypothetical protein SMAX5B_001403 [Scophthalmus maximus]KAF0022097.1 hypothetical protein F2P81_025649 [Scophthalmus maximus]KAF0022103.1 hypothetical protein F2P81_025648 [Scophthalmus maximus]